ncbi:MAG TPA: S41 family peptidase [Pseudomonadales bacterium]
MSASSTQHLLFLGLAALALAGCGGGGGGGTTRPIRTVDPPTTALPAPHSQCSLADARREVLDLFEDFYFFNTEPAQVAKYADVRARLSSFASVDALLDELRYQPGTYDRGFTYYATEEEVEQYYAAGEFYGFGFSVGIDDTGAWRLLDVFGGSPADDAGLARGDTIVAVDGTATANLNLNSESTFGPSEVGVERTLTVRHLDDSVEDVTLVKAVVDLDPVPPAKVRVFDVGGRMVGYVLFRTFIENADALLRDAMVSLVDQAAALGGAGIDDLVLDLRYNGGGLVDTAEVLGSLVTGRDGDIFFSYEYNDWVTDNYGDANDDVRRFQLEADALVGLENIYYLTDAGTASASELAISGLSPYMTRSVSIGARTYGKPVGQWGLEYCNSSMVLFIVTFRTVNSLGEGDYYTGIPADCAAPDDWDHPLGDPAEARLDAALDYIESNGALCTAPVLRAAAQSLAGAPVVELPGAIAGPSLAAKLIRAF